MIRLQPGNTIFHGRPGHTESVIIEVPQVGWKPAHYPEDSPVLDYTDEDLTEARGKGKLWAEYEDLARQMGRDVVERASFDTETRVQTPGLPVNLYPMERWVVDLRKQEGLHHLVAADLHQRDI